MIPRIISQNFCNLSEHIKIYTETHMPAVSVNAVVNMPSLKELNKSVLLSKRLFIYLRSNLFS